MKKMRTLIERYPDGNLVVKKEVLRTNDRGGSAHERKLAKKNPPQPEWVRAERKIVRSDVLDSSSVLQERIELLPFGSPSIATAAAENEQIAKRFTQEAFQSVQRAAMDAERFRADTERCKIRRVKKVVLVNEDGSAEEL